MIKNIFKDKIVAVLSGCENSLIRGTVMFMPHLQGTWVTVEATGLPDGFHGFHLHSNVVCDKENCFDSAGGHYNPTNQQHPFHAGDFPPILSNNKIAQMSFYTDRFTPEEAVGKAVIIHENPDDFSSDPSGRSGSRIACGVVTKY